MKFIRQPEKRVLKEDPKSIEKQAQKSLESAKGAKAGGPRASDMEFLSPPGGGAAVWGGVGRYPAAGAAVPVTASHGGTCHSCSTAGAVPQGVEKKNKKIKFLLQDIYNYTWRLIILGSRASQNYPLAPVLILNGAKYYLSCVVNIGTIYKIII